MSYTSHFRLCYNCGGVSEAKRDWASGAVLRVLDNCDHCKAPLTADDDYDTVRLPHSKAEPHPSFCMGCGECMANWPPKNNVLGYF